MPPRRTRENTDQGEAQTPKRGGRTRRAPVPADATPPQPATPAPTRRQRRQPAPPVEPEVQAPPDGPEGPPVATEDEASVFGDDSPAGVGAQRRRNVHFGNDSDGEHFPSPPPSSASPTPSNHSPLPTPSRRRQRGSPRAGPHSSPFRAPLARPAGGRSSSARDVWTFFEEKGANKRECLFCKQHHAVDSHVKSTTFAITTSSGILRKHLYEHHLEA
ncbi:hypothetical protein B0H10DRAFT_752806 [Mycena sp. CBHHK59/15]|nr:hypothetical protein B0H10DRAFT_752806 [Mycena sp. CBHHK59/15]